MTDDPGAEATKEKPIYYCNFCGKSTKEVAAMIAGPTTFICDECIELCTSMFAEEAAKVDAEKQERHVGLPGEFRDTNEWERRQGGIWAKTILKRLPKGTLTPPDFAQRNGFRQPDCHAPRQDRISAWIQCRHEAGLYFPAQV